MHSSQPSTDLTPRKRVIVGLAVIALGLLVGALMTLNPEKLRVPSWVALTASGSFVIAGFAMVVRDFVSEKFYDWTVAVLVALLAAIPTWVAFGPGERACIAVIPFIAAELGCRVGFGLGSTILLGLLVLVIRQALRKTYAA